MFDDNGLNSWKSEEDHLADLEELGLRFQYGCDMDKMPESCNSLGVWYQTFKNNKEKALEIYEKNCKVNKFPDSCLNYGVGLFLGEGITKNVETAFNVFKDNCDERNNSRSCFGVAEILNKGSSVIESMKYFEKSCELGYDMGCVFFGLHHIVDDRIPNKDPEKGLKIITKTCDSGSAHACLWLAKLYKDGIYIEKNIKKSEEILANVMQL